MYTFKNKVFADAGCILQYKNKVAFNLEDVDKNDVLEIKFNLENIQKIGNFVVYSCGLKDHIDSINWKKKWVNKQFTNDDQIAIILNKDNSEEDLFLFNKMQEWRQWSGVVAKTIESIL